MLCFKIPEQNKRYQSSLLSTTASCNSLPCKEVFRLRKRRITKVCMQGQMWDDLLLRYLINVKVLAFYIYLVYYFRRNSKSFSWGWENKYPNINHLQYEDFNRFSVFTVSKCQFFKIFLAYLQSKNFKIVSQ